MLNNLSSESDDYYYREVSSSSKNLDSSKDLAYDQENQPYNQVNLNKISLNPNT